MTRLVLVAGEASGDLQGALLARALRAQEPGIDLAGVGGAEMADAGVRILHRSEEMAVTGLWEVLSHLPRLKAILDRLSAELRADPPDALVPIDYPDFNLRLAARAHASGIPIIYYISPQVWAWRKGRLRTLARLVRRMIVIFPFEEQLYRDHGVPVTYVGHPLVDRVHATAGREAFRARLGIGEHERFVGLLPGSRRSEIARILPPMLEARRRLEGERRIRWALALAPGLTMDDLPDGARDEADLTILTSGTYDLMAAADLLVTASGTATAEAALLGTPMIVVYRMHPVTWEIARRLVKVPHIAMANLLAGRRLVPELLQGDVNGRRLADEIERLLGDAALLRATREGLREAASRLGPGGAPERAAAAILRELAVR
jgi:lipid-A-disaccharide synthase